eukprot:759289-Hanusia_phi.AAC.4
MALAVSSNCATCDSEGQSDLSMTHDDARMIYRSRKPVRSSLIGLVDLDWISEEGGVARRIKI